MMYALGVPSWNIERFDYVIVEFETEVWSNSKGDTREEVVGAKVTFDINPKRATFFDYEHEAFDALDTLKKLDAAGKVKCVKYGYDESWGTPGVDVLAVFKLSQTKLDAPEI